MKLKEYLPRFYHGVFEFMALLETEDRELDTLKKYIQNLSNENALLACGEEMVRQWESFLGIDPLGDLSQRKMFLLATLRGQGKLNEEKINQIINAFTGAEHSALVDFVDSKIRVRVLPPAWGDIYIFPQIKEALMPRIPGHLDLIVEKYYYTWDDIQKNHLSWQEVKNAFISWEHVKIRIEENE